MKKPCARPGCPRLVERGYCQEHEALSARARTDRQRGGSSRRGYGYKWQRERRRHLDDNPLCVDPYKRHVDHETAATDVDHIIPVSGPNDPLFWDEDNWQSLCHECHSYKTATQDGGLGRGGRGSKSLATQAA